MTNYVVTPPSPEAVRRIVDIHAARQAGLTLRRIAKIHNISNPRVHQILKFWARPDRAALLQKLAVQVYEAPSP